MTQGIKYVVPGVFALLLALTVACGSPAATPENTPPPAVATEAPALPTATMVPQQSAEATSTPEPPTAAADDEKRPILNAGVIWLDSPLDPVESGWVANQSGMSENLFRLSATDLSPEPWLATSATRLDPLTWEIELRPDVKFHNGAVMDAHAVKASLERTIRLSSASAESLTIDTVTVTGEHTITVVTTAPQPTLPGLLTVPAVAITDAAAADAAGEGNFIAAGALTGPYIPTEYIQKERLSSVSNDHYWGGAPKLAGIEHIAIPDPNSRELALQAGDIDIAVTISPEGVQTIDAQPGMHSQTAGKGIAVVMWWVNFERGTLADPLVRRAVDQAIDREGIAALVAPEGSGSYAELLLPEDMASCPGVHAPGYDPDAARDLLAQAGYADTDGDGILDKDGQPLEIVIGGYPQRFQLPIMAEAAQAMLADVGIKAEVLITEWSVVKEPAWDLFGWYNNVIEAGDPVRNVGKFAGLRADASGSGANNYGHYDNSGLVDIVARSSTAVDPNERAKIACDALAVVTEESAFLPVAHMYMVYGVSERVTGFEPHPANLYFFDHRIGLSE
jgi:peptide/nickel transport system substrate-binding protein